MKNDTLGEYTAQEIADAASKVGMIVKVHNRKIVMPTQKADFNNLLRFLDDSFYKAALSGQKYITNSKRTAD